MNPYGPNYQRLRLEALKQNDGICKFCGVAPSTEAHHAMKIYCDHADLRDDHLVPLCKDCHDLATSIRKWCWRFNSTPAKIAHALIDEMRDKGFSKKVRGVKDSDIHKGSSEVVRIRKSKYEGDLTTSIPNVPEPKIRIRKSKYD